MPFPIDCDSAKCAFYFFEHYPALVMFETCPTSDTHAEKTKSTGEEVRLPLWCFYRYRRLHHLCHEAAHGLGGFILLLAGGVSVGAQGESRIVMSQHAADGFHVYTVLQGQRGECVPLRYNYDKPEKTRISRVFGYLARFFILFQTEKSSREVVIS